MSETTVDKYDIHREVADDKQWAFKWKDIEEVDADAENCCNLFTAEQLEASEAVRTAWRVNLNQVSSTIMPKKMILTLKRRLELHPGYAARLI